ncbi:MAG: chorismate mutase [Chloroflexi bacterium]|nr:chorismate mutase [Chloroflexota bacterium]
MMRGIRGATTVAADTVDDIAAATQELLREIVERNGVELADVAAATFSVTADVRAGFPAAAARAIGWERVPMDCYQQMHVASALPRCIRVLVFWNTERAQDEIRHVYLREAARLRPDLASDSR